MHILILKIESWLAKMTLLLLHKRYSKKQGIYIKAEREKEKKKSFFLSSSITERS